MANACDDYEQPEIDWLFNAADAISEAPNRACAVDELRKVLKAERERTADKLLQAFEEYQWAAKSSMGTVPDDVLRRILNQKLNEGP